jgi:hypothetical protein
MSETQYPNQQQLGRDSTCFLAFLVRKDGQKVRKGRLKKQAQKCRSKKPKPGFGTGLG